MSPAPRKDCRDARRAIERAFDGTLPIEGQFALEEHVERCAGCRARYEASARLREALAALPSPPLERVDVERSLERIHAALDAPAAGRPRSRSRLAAAALVLLTGSIAAALALRHGADREDTPAAPPAPRLALPSPALPPARPDPAWPDPARPVPVELAPEPEPETAGDDVPAVLALASVPDPDFDPVRQERARELVRAALLASAPELRRAADADARRAVAEAFEARARTGVGDGWPLVRMVEECLRGEDTATACAAARYLGVRAERLSIGALEEALARPDRREAALEGLVDAGERGLEVLARAVWEPELASAVVARLERLDAGATIEWVRRALARPSRGRSDARVSGVAEALLGLLAGCGRAGAQELLALADDPAFDPGSVLDALARTDGAAEVVERAVRSGVSSRATPFVLRAVGRLHPAGTLEWVDELCRASRVDAAEALGVLATFDGPDAVAALLDLTLVGRVRDDLAPLVWRRAVERGPERLEIVARAALAAADRVASRRLLESLVLAEHPSAVPALLTLAASELLGDDERERAILAAGEIGLPEHVGRLAALFARLRRGERGRAAACVLAAHAIGGADAARTVLGAAAEPMLERVLELLARPSGRGGTALTLFQLARALEPALAPSEVEPWRTSS